MLSKLRPPLPKREEYGEKPSQMKHDGAHEEGGEKHIGHSLMEQASKHPDGGMHMHIHHDGMGGGFTTHHVGEDGQVQGPHEHPDKESLTNHIHNFFGGGEESQGDGEQNYNKAHQAYEGAHSLSGI